MAFQNATNAALNLQATYRGGAVTRANASQFIPELWSSEVQRERDLSFVVSRYVKMLTGQFSKGDRLNIPRISRAAVNVKLPETPVFLQSRTDSSFFVDIDRYMESSFMIEDIVNIQSAYNLRAEYGREAGYALARDIDNYILALRATINAAAVNGIAGSQRVISGGTAAAPLNYSALLTGKLILDRAAVPEQDRVLIVTPTQYNQLLAVERFINIDYRDSKPVESGRVGTIFNMPVIMSTNAGANTNNGYVNGAGAAGTFTPGAVGSPYYPTQDSLPGAPVANTTPNTLPIGWSGSTNPGAVAANTTTTTGGYPVAVAAGSTTPGFNEVHTAIMCHKDWAVMAMQKSPSAESSRETLYLADALVYSQVYGGRVYRPDHAVVIHSDGSIPSTIS